MTCPDCDSEINTKDAEIGEILSCPCCGLEVELLNDGTIQELTIEGEDWGE